MYESPERQVRESHFTSLSRVRTFFFLTCFTDGKKTGGTYFPFPWIIMSEDKWIQIRCMSLPWLRDEAETDRKRVRAPDSAAVKPLWRVEFPESPAKWSTKSGSLLSVRLLCTSSDGGKQTKLTSSHRFTHSPDVESYCVDSSCFWICCFLAQTLHGQKEVVKHLRAGSSAGWLCGLTSLRSSDTLLANRVSAVSVSCE